MESSHSGFSEESLQTNTELHATSIYSQLSSHSLSPLIPFLPASLAHCLCGCSLFRHEPQSTQSSKRRQSAWQEFVPHRFSADQGVHPAYTSNSDFIKGLIAWRPANLTLNLARFTLPNIALQLYELQTSKPLFYFFFHVLIHHSKATAPPYMHKYFMVNEPLWLTQNDFPMQSNCISVP